MSSDVLDAQERISNPSPCLYYLVSGQVLFSEEVEVIEEGYRFDLERTAIVQIRKTPDPDKPGQAIIAMAGGKIAGSDAGAPFAPLHRFVPLTSVLYVDDVTDARAMKAMRGMISKLILL